MRLPSNMEHVFSAVPTIELQRSVFDRSCDNKTTFNADYLVPFLYEEILPGDSFALDATCFLRFASPMKMPVMSNIYLDTFFFFVPNRLVWSNWQAFMGEREPGHENDVYTVPVFTAYAPAELSLSDYMGVPISGASTPLGAGGTVSHISLPWRGYNRIYNEWFRDENLIASATVDMGNGPYSIANYTLRNRGKRKDYFTSALPWTQKGTAVTAPVGGNAPVVDKDTTGIHMKQYVTNATFNLAGNNTATTIQKTGAAFGSADLIHLDPADSGLVANLAAASGLSINDLRLAFQTQKMLERDARGGSRYIEILKAHFQVTSPDARLQRTEFLGGRSNRVDITPVPQTSASNTQPTPQGNLSAYATAVSTRDGFTKSFVEHGFVLGLCMVRADYNYQYGLRREFSRSTRLDYYWPELCCIGEQAILNKEIYCQGSANPSQDAAVFGYAERYAEYRYAPSMITGRLRSSAATPLDAWHLAQAFVGLPTLGQTFIEEAMPVDRIVAVTSATQPSFVLDVFIKNRATRPMPVFSVPGLIDHF